MAFSLEAGWIGDPISGAADGKLYPEIPRPQKGRAVPLGSLLTRPARPFRAGPAGCRSEGQAMNL
jgi:hypothetical protein